MKGTLWADSDVTTIAPVLIGVLYRLTIRYILFDPRDVFTVGGLGSAEGRICIFADGGTHAEQDKDSYREAQGVELEDDSSKEILHRQQAMGQRIVIRLHRECGGVQPR